MPPLDHMAEATPANQVAGFIAKFDPTVAKLARQCRAVLRKRMPAAAEVVYDSYNALAIGFGPTERTSECIVSLAVYARGVNLYFMYGALLPDPHKLLLGKGNQGRFVRLTSAVDLKKREVEQLLREAIRQADPAAEAKRTWPHDNQVDLQEATVAPPCSVNAPDGAMN